MCGAVPRDSGPGGIFTEHRMVCVGGDHKDHLAPSPLPWTGTHFTGPGCSKPHPAPSYIVAEPSSELPEEASAGLDCPLRKVKTRGVWAANLDMCYQHGK